LLLFQLPAKQGSNFVNTGPKGSGLLDKHAVFMFTTSKAICGQAQSRRHLRRGEKTFISVSKMTEVVNGFIVIGVLLFLILCVLCVLVFFLIRAEQRIGHVREDIESARRDILTAFSEHPA